MPSEKSSPPASEHHAPAAQDKPIPSADYIENYQGKSGYSKNFAAVSPHSALDGVVWGVMLTNLYIAKTLKTNRKGTKILWPQPSDDPNDPQNWSPVKKNIQLLVLTMASFVPDFCSGIGIAGLFGLAATFETTTDEINNLTSNWSIFCLGPGGIIAVMLIKRYGRLPFIGLGFLIGCAVAPNLKTFAAMRILNALFSTAPQCAGLFTVCDLFPFHLQARKINLWTMGFIVSPFISPFLLGFMVASKSWRDAYWVGVAYVAIVVLLIVFVMEETMYDRDVVPFPERPTSGLRYRIETLLGITGLKMAKYRCSWIESVTTMFDLVWRPHCLLILIYVGVTFGFGIGINVTNAVFTGTPPPVGYGFSSYGTSASYATPIVAVILGELAGRYVNDMVADRLIKRNNGVFYAEYRLWTTYLAIPLFVAGFVTLGAAFQKKLSIAALVFGWGMAEFAILINTVAVYNYLNNCFPSRQGEVSALVNFARTMGGFAVPYYQVPWSEAVGTLKVFGMEAGVAAGLFLLIIPFLQIKGPALRHKFSVKH
ncbi:Mfs transporter [Pseudohyphozyma bogoriensis]|nr:Mfs transporter [Pseudohyphozyma bogoriensis]